MSKRIDDRWDNFKKLYTPKQNPQIYVDIGYGDGEITKEFVVHNSVYKIDMRIAITPLAGEVIDYVRVLYPSPIMSDIIATDTISSVLITNEEKFLKSSG